MSVANTTVDELLTEASAGFSFTCAPAPDHLHGLLVLGINKTGNPEEGPGRIFFLTEEFDWYEAHKNNIATLCDETLSAMLTFAASTYIDKALYPNSGDIAEC